ncbi:MAG: VOC family protein [Nitrospira sp.]|nr:VOC family protein [Nitrospira sp.]
MWLGFCGLLALSAPAWAGEESQSHAALPSSETASTQRSSSLSCLQDGGDQGARGVGQDAAPAQFEYIQIETSDIARHELFFEKILQAERRETIDHPQKDAIRGYCYRHVHVVIRQDVQHPRPTGWVQLNFEVPDARAVHAELSQISERSLPATMSEEERQQVVRFKLKPEVTRGHRKAVRLEVYGPEGFLIGFDQYTAAP